MFLRSKVFKNKKVIKQSGFLFVFFVSPNLQHHTVYAPRLIIPSLLMPANSCHGDSEALGGVRLQMLEEANNSDKEE